MAGVFDIDINDIDGNNVDLDEESDDDVIDVEVNSYSSIYKWVTHSK